MPILVPTIPPQAAEVRPYWEMETPAIAQGNEAEQMQLQFDILKAHWTERSPDADLQTDLLDAFDDFGQLPFERVGTVRMRFTEVRDLAPREIDWNIDEFEDDL